ncbi:UvrD-helicase domain-containing protein [Bradyrhizobium sp. AUGA SZCCT0240]|uniref:ATP-dependent helicase n=1 Tax=Bradyrhizobium sp. AUGA SZCCT0240 TaxID=2807669 RepID=UPI001BAAB9A6|nr:ATP-dependent helicase [Bradyrhizobium sp. AUGA SZCCT0240]MBR1256413.1 UvrD-helicase domain-containing protein [Bradyrhizobium sp. AUGA SZCCT0240]
MKSFETIRGIAAQLHAQLIAEGADPYNPESLIAQAITHFDLELTFLEVSDPALKGAKALYDEQSGTICAAKAGTPVERALVVGHEIGHLVIHPGSCSCADLDIDASRSTEAAPVGLQKVEDYGARERRELEANVFARELMLPRGLARKLFIEDGSGADDIAKSSRLPLPLVRQQILDAVLLPVIEDEKAKPAAVLKDDPVQTRAAEHRNSPYQLRAGPGTGKTRSLVERIKSLLAEEVQPSAILVLTFSNRTAGELSERLAQALNDKATAIWVGTFHGFGLDLVRRYHDKLGLPANPTLFDRSDAIAVLEEILPTLPLKHYKNLWDPVIVLRDILQAISRAKDEVTTAEDYRKLALAQDQRARASGDPDAIKAAEKVLEVASVYELYENAKTARKAVDFGDLIMLPALLLERDDAVRAATRLRHRHLLVDEYQDVNRASVRLVKALAGEGNNLWVVGDARQSIYRFRGASSANLAAFADDFPGATWEPLGINYRSTQKVINAYSAFAAGMPMPVDLAKLSLMASRGEGTVLPEIRGFDMPDDEAAGIAASIRELQQQGVALRDQAVLCRTNPRIDEIARALEARGIPVLHLGSLFERDEIRDLLSLLSLATDRLGAGLVRVGAMPRYRIPLQDVKRLLEHLRGGEKPALSRLKELASLPGLSASTAASINRLASDCTGMKPSQNAWDFLTTVLLDRSDFVRSIVSGGDIADRMRGIAVWQFLNFLREQSPVAKGSPIYTALERVRNLVLLAEERDLRQVPEAALQMDAVRLMTIHASKGLEFDAVHIPGLIVTGLPANNQAVKCPPPEGMIAGGKGSVSEQGQLSHKQEEECLFFVAMSRARTYLLLYFTRRQKNGETRNPSTFLSRIASNMRRLESGPTLPLSITPPPTTIRVNMPDWSPTDRGMKSYEDCPRRFFYTHLLRIGTARRSTAFERTHSCIYELISWLSKARVDGNPTSEETHAAFDEIWKTKGPSDPSFIQDYRDLARKLVDGLIEVGAGRRFREAQPLAIDFANGKVLVEPAEIAERSDGVIVIRRIRSGHRGDKEFDKLQYFLYQKAALQHFGANAAVEAVHLTDNEAAEMPRLSRTQTENRTKKAEKLLAGIRAGMFDPLRDTFSCPRCPHFFICAATPDGDLTFS